MLVFSSETSSKNISMAPRIPGANLDVPWMFLKRQNHRMVFKIEKIREKFTQNHENCTGRNEKRRLRQCNCKQCMIPCVPCGQNTWSWWGEGEGEGKARAGRDPAKWQTQWADVEGSELEFGWRGRAFYLNFLPVLELLGFQLKSTLGCMSLDFKDFLCMRVCQYSLFDNWGISWSLCFLLCSQVRAGHCILEAVK